MLSESQIVPYETRELPVERGPWLVFAPHADDESFGMGGTLAKAAEQGIACHLVVMTDGALGGKADNLVATRKQEARAAAAVLGMHEPVFLGYSDRGLQMTEAVIERLSQIIRQVNPAAVYFPGCFELHPDHRMTAALVWCALRSIADQQIVPVSYEILVQSPVNTLVNITNHLQAKKKAMQVYASQLTENRYIDIALALNVLRALTLRGEISHAEAFNCFSPTDVKANLEEILIEKLRPIFDI